MSNVIAPFLLLVLILAGCTGQNAPKNPVCGDDVCQAGENQSCAADCGGVAGITEQQCIRAKGHWNDCGSVCAGTGAEFCIQVCSSQCECNGIAGFACPEGYRCRLSGKIADELGVCVQ